MNQRSDATRATEAAHGTHQITRCFSPRPTSPRCHGRPLTTEPARVRCAALCLTTTRSRRHAIDATTLTIARRFHQHGPVAEERLAGDAVGGRGALVRGAGGRAQASSGVRRALFAAGVQARACASAAAATRCICIGARVVLCLLRGCTVFSVSRFRFSR